MEDHVNDRTKAQKEQDKKEALALLAQMEKEEKEAAEKMRAAEKDAEKDKPESDSSGSNHSGSDNPGKDNSGKDNSGKNRSEKDSRDDWKDLIYPENNRKMKRRGAFLLPLLFVALLAAAGIFWIIRYMPTGKHMDLRAYFEEMMSTQTERKTLSDDELAVVVNETVCPEKARMINGSVYFDYEMARRDLNSRFFWDEENAQLLFTTAYETYEIPVNSTVYTIDGAEESWSEPVIIQDERGLYLSAGFLERFTNVEYIMAPEHNEHIRVRCEWGTRLCADVKRESAVRFYGGVKSLIVTDVVKGSAVQVLDRLEKWSRVVTEDGCIGYIRNKDITEPEERSITHEFDEIEYPSLVSGETINLVWHMIGLEESNDYFSSDTEGMKGVNVISPTWFSLTDNEGNISSFASKAYVRKAHKKGLQVWGLVSNFSPDMNTSVLLSSTSARRNLTANLINEALGCGMDGINVDLEAIAEEAGYAYVQFMRELSIACRKNELVLSVDVPVPFDFNMYYDREELGTVADYVIIMGYDEHYHGSEAGSVASLSFEKKGIEETLKEVAPEKIISGVPFYTRMWYTLDDGAGNENTWSEVLGMRAVLNTLDTYGVTPQWDEDAQQYLASWNLDDGTLCRIWMEEETSLALKAGLVKEYGLGGIAEWALGNQINEMWDVISDSIS